MATVEPSEDTAPLRLDARSAALTGVAQAAGRGVTLVAVIVSTAVVVHAVGVSVYADWATVLSLVSLMAFVLDPGVSAVIVRRLAQSPDTAPSPRAMMLARIGMAMLAFGVVVGMSVILRGPHVIGLAVALAASVLPRGLVLNATAWLQADHRLHRQTAWEAVCAGLGLTALVVAGAAGAGPVVLAVVGFLAPTTLLAVFIQRELARTPSLHLSSPGPQRPRVRSVLREVAPLAAALLLLTLYTRIFVVFVNAAEDTTEIARYLFAFQFVEQVIVVAGIVAGTLLPLLALRARAVELRSDRSTLALVLAVTASGAILAAGLVALAPVLCRVIGGSGLADADHYLTLLSPMATVILPAFVLGYLYIALGEAHRYLWFNVFALAFNLAANASLTLTIGASATARISWATELIVVVLAVSPLLRGAPAGRSTGIRMAALMVTTVLGAELVAAGAPRLPLALAMAACAGVAGGRAIREFALKLRRPAPVA
jgi:O-antigen/teichoic acid export membrane protein